MLLDRDGTIVRAAPHGQRYLERPEDVTLLPGVREAIARLNRRGIRVAVVSNQRGIATGVITAEGCRRIHMRISELLGPQARIDDWFVCPHDVGQCACRKPEPGLLLAALDRFEVPSEDAVMVGNAPSDLLGGVAAGVRAIGVGLDLAPPANMGMAWSDSLAGAVDLILVDQS